MVTEKTYFEANEKRKWHGDEDEQPADDGQDPSAHSDARVAIPGFIIFIFVFCFFLEKEKKNKKKKKMSENDFK